MRLSDGVISMIDMKKEFPLLSENSELVYLDSAATTQKPLRVIEALTDFYREENANPLRGLYGLSVKATESYESAREAVRRFIGAKSAKEIIFTRNATESINLVAGSFGRENVCRGSEILVAVSEHHSNLLPWQNLAAQTGAKLRYLECSQDGEYTAQALRNALNPNTVLFAAAQMSNIFGRVNPIREFSQICHENGTVIVCDGAQSVPHLPVNVEELGVDFFAFSGHKLYAPMGIGVLYGKERLLENMPPFLYGGEMIEYVTRESATFAELPHKFEAGTVNAGGAVGLHAAIDFVNEIGFDTIMKREEALTELALSQMKEIPHVHVVGSENANDHNGIITFTIDGVHPHDIAAFFDFDGIAVRAGHHCAQPLHQFLNVQSTARMSIGLYNDEHDIERFIATLKTVRRRMGYER